MTQRATTLLAAAAGLVLSTGSFTFAQTPDAAEQAQQAAQQAKQQAQQAAQQAAQSGQAAVQGGQSAQQGQQVDQQIQQQLQQIQQQGGPTAADKLFVLRAAIDNMEEIQLSQQAQQKAQSQQVKQLAQHILQDHQQAAQQLQQVAQQMQLQVPQSLPSIKQQEIQILTALPAQQFEQQYVAHMIASHAKDVAKFQSVSQLSQSQPLKQFASQLLPKLQQHAQMTTQTAQAVGLTAGGSDAQPASGTVPGSSTPPSTPGTSGGTSGGSTGGTSR